MKVSLKDKVGSATAGLRNWTLGTASGLSAAGILALLPTASQAGVQDGSSTDVAVTTILRSTTTNSGGPVEMPAGRLAVEVFRYEIAAGASLPVHKHPFPRYGYLLAGSLRVRNVETGKSRLFQAGSFILEDIDTWHEAQNAGRIPVKLLVIDFTPPGAKNVVGADGPRRNRPRRDKAGRSG